MAGQYLAVEARQIVRAVAADDLGQLDHRLDAGVKLLQRDIEAGENPGGEVGVDGGGLQRLVPEKFLDDPQIDAALQKMGGIRVPQGMHARRLLHPALADGLRKARCRAQIESDPPYLPGKNHERHRTRCRKSWSAANIPVGTGTERSLPPLPSRTQTSRRSQSTSAGFNRAASDTRSPHR